MGAEPYYYFVPYQPDIAAALHALRQREFEAGRYNPAMPFPSECFPLGPDSPAPGRQHMSIEAAFEEADADGTRSILDITSISDTPDYGVAVRVSDADLVGLYGTPRPSRAQIGRGMPFFDDIERGQAIYFVIYEGDVPAEIFFAGYSYD
jgi:hypothetical protein